MTEQIRRQLEVACPQDEGMTEELKQQTLQRAQKRFEGGSMKPRRNLVPLITGAAALVLTVLLLIPFADHMQNKHAFEEAVKHEVIRKAVIPDTPYPDLITSVFVEENDEIIHAKSDGIYTYSIVNRTDEKLADLPSDTPFSSVTIQANARWLVWETDILHIVDRQTGDHLGLDSVLGTQLLRDDRLFYIDDIEPDGRVMAYFTRDLLSGKITKLHDLDGVSHSEPLVTGNLFVAVEQRETAEGVFVYLTVYNWETSSHMKEIKLQAADAAGLQLDGNRVYGRFTDQAGKMAVGYVDLDSGEYQATAAASDGDFAVHGSYLAISHPDGESDTVALYRLMNDQMESLSLLEGSPDRLVKPRFTQSGQLIVNGEGPDTPIYIIDTAKLNDQ
ncbi:hypothetical protein [Sporosarcina koreensis]|uniref:hypothetical protein n=1 Tax=Sporosarcina koreensis TaxID=334735 RepID=UPI0005912135|nr:hypothetical protein [Sporosarcina koreensis]